MNNEDAPSAKLSAIAVDRLIASGLLRPSKRDALIAKIAAGTMSGLDWKVEIDLASAKAGEQ